jgi:hypothetical protein
MKIRENHYNQKYFAISYSFFGYFFSIKSVNKINLKMYQLFFNSFPFSIIGFKIMILFDIF